MARNSETVAAAIEAVNTIISEQNAALKALKDTLSQKAAGGGTGSSGIYMAKITPEEDLEASSEEFFDEDDLEEEYTPSED